MVLERFQGRDDYKINLKAGYNTTGTGSGTTGWLDLGEYPDQVDLIMDCQALATANTIAVTGYQNSTSVATGSATLSLDAGISTITGTGQVKQRLQAGDDAGDWDGPVDGRYVMFTAVIAGTNTTGATLLIGATLTIQSREYPVE